LILRWELFIFGKANLNSIHFVSFNSAFPMQRLLVYPVRNASFAEIFRLPNPREAGMGRE
jgi:hypothetical protein